MEVFITGMGRSGTTLIEKILNSHKNISILSQPFPLLFVFMKRRFLSSMNNNKYYVLNDGPNNGEYELSDFYKFINDYEIDEKDINDVFEEMSHYSGQKTKVRKINNYQSLIFLELFKKLVNDVPEDPVLNIYGSKEVFCEEYMPYFVSHGVKCIAIVRDPRDVLASANYPQERKYIGNKKPALFILRNWRKSIEYINSLIGNDNFFCLRYEDLILCPEQVLGQITNFLGVNAFADNHLDNGVVGQDGSLWRANTSFQGADTFLSDKSIGKYKEVLSEIEINYTEVICSNEMKLFNYSIKNCHDRQQVITNFKDIGVADSEYLSADYSTQMNNVLFELSRNISY